MNEFERHLDQLEHLISLRILNNDSGLSSHFSGTNFSDEFLPDGNWTKEEKMILIFLIGLHTKPNLHLQLSNLEAQTRLIVGGVLNHQTSRFIPTLRTCLFLLGGSDFDNQMNYFELFHPHHPLFTQGIIELRNPLNEPSRLNHELHLNDSWLLHFLTGAPPKLDGDEGFPAKLSTASLEFDDLVLPPTCAGQVQEILKYFQVRRKLFAMEGVAGKIRSSYVAVFTGEPGTGKTITAKTMGKQLGIPVYVVNLARVVSKYIGETEKNLERVFDRFNGQDCILFFDEADALFGKRTEVKEAKDRYANQEVAFLLQKIEEFNGVIILASNVHDVNQVFDKAFQRRIRRTVRFEFPEEQERLLLWQKALPSSFRYEEGLPQKLATSYQLTGASISNVIADTLIDTVYHDRTTVTEQLLNPHLNTEFRKTGRKMQVITDKDAERDPKLRYGSNYMRGDFG